MTRIGLTQRVEVVEEYDERRDCLDQRWGPLLESFGLIPIPLFNRIEDIEAYVDRLNLDGIVVTGGNDLAHLGAGTNLAPERDRFERELLEIAIERDFPVLGVCRGLQLINVHFGGSITEVDDHVAIKHDLKIDPRMTSTADPPASVLVNSYHRYGVNKEGLSDKLVAAGHAPDGSVEWIEHEHHPITAIMWHPERDSPSAELDRRIIKGHLPTELI